MKYYATGNAGYGTRCLVFGSKDERDEFVSWGDEDLRSELTRADAIRIYKRAEVSGSMAYGNSTESWINIATCDAI